MKYNNFLAFVVFFVMLVYLFGFVSAADGDVASGGQIREAIDSKYDSKFASDNADKGIFSTIGNWFSNLGNKAGDLFWTLARNSAIDNSVDLQLDEYRKMKAERGDLVSNSDESDGKNIITEEVESIYGLGCLDTYIDENTGEAIEYYVNEFKYDETGTFQCMFDGTEYYWVEINIVDLNGLRMLGEDCTSDAECKSNYCNPDLVVCDEYYYSGEECDPNDPENEYDPISCTSCRYDESLGVGKWIPMCDSYTQYCDGEGRCVASEFQDGGCVADEYTGATYDCADWDGSEGTMYEYYTDSGCNTDWDSSGCIWSEDESSWFGWVKDYWGGEDPCAGDDSGCCWDAVCLCEQGYEGYEDYC